VGEGAEFGRQRLLALVRELIKERRLRVRVA
jgi:hypothetical protein